MELLRSDSSSLPSTARKEHKPGIIWHLRKRLTRFAPKQPSRARSSLRACPTRHLRTNYCIGPDRPKPTAGLQSNQEEHNEPSYHSQLICNHGIGIRHATVQRSRPNKVAQGASRWSLDIRVISQHE